MIQKPRTRYFLIMFSGINKQRQPVSATIEHEGKAYPSKEKIMAHIKREYGCEEYYLRNILELNREDFESYTGVKELSHGATLSDSYSEIEKSELEKLCDINQIPYTKDLAGMVIVDAFQLTDYQKSIVRGYMEQQFQPVNPEAEGCGA